MQHTSTLCSHPRPRLSTPSTPLPASTLEPGTSPHWPVHLEALALPFAPGRPSPYSLLSWPCPSIDYQPELQRRRRRRHRLYTHCRPLASPRIALSTGTTTLKCPQCALLPLYATLLRNKTITDCLANIGAGFSTSVASLDNNKLYLQFIAFVRPFANLLDTTCTDRVWQIL